MWQEPFGLPKPECSHLPAPLLLTLEEGYLLTATPPVLARGVAPLGPPVPTQPLLLGRGLAPLSHCSWPRKWGSASWLLLRCHSLALSAITSDLGHGVAPLGLAPRAWGPPSFCP